MKSLQNPADKRAFINRIQALTPDAQAGWGKMRVDQMLRHLSELVETATGTRSQKSNWLVTLLTPIIGGLLKSRPWLKVWSKSRIWQLADSLCVPESH